MTNQFDQLLADFSDGASDVIDAHVASKTGVRSPSLSVRGDGQQARQANAGSLCLDALRKAPTDSHQPRVSQKIELTAGLSVRERAQARSLSAQKLEVRRLGGASASCSRRDR
jgi:hypothetical protein